MTVEPSYTSRICTCAPPQSGRLAQVPSGPTFRVKSSQATPREPWAAPLYVVRSNANAPDRPDAASKNGCGLARWTGFPPPRGTYPKTSRISSEKRAAISAPRVLLPQNPKVNTGSARIASDNRNAPIISMIAPFFQEYGRDHKQQLVFTLELLERPCLLDR